MRYPAVAGRFYSDSSSSLRNEVERCFLHPLGPGEIPGVIRGERSIVGAVVPHASLAASGWVAAYVYDALARDGFPEAFIVIGPNHQGFGSAVSLTSQEFVTPLGTTKVDKELIRRLERRIDDEPYSHQYEHSVEVQLPFIQYLAPETPFVPILMSLQDYETAIELGKVISEAIHGRDVVVIASSDFSHYVSPQEARDKDNAVIKRILDLDSKGVYETVLRKNVSTCGYGPVMAMLEAVGGSKGELLRYGHSGEVFPSREVVGYGAIVIRR
jgi:AmmeMemoRadiSam system protein B